MNNLWIKAALLALALIFSLPNPYTSRAQTTFIVESIPNYTPVEDTLFLVGNFNDWNPKDTSHQLKKGEDGTYWIDVDNLPMPTEFKLTRGSWPKVEGSQLGQPIDNRIFNMKRTRDTVRLTVLSWEDLSSHIPFLKKIKIKVTSIPKSTPRDASIYIAGNFNEWNPRNEEHKLKQDFDGTYTTWIPIRKDTIEYKFTRGSWSSVEGANSGRARLNRVYIDSKESSDLVQAEIQTWEDLSGDPINSYTFLLLLAAFQGLLLIIAINTIQDNNVSANRILSVLILLISIALIGRVSTYGREIFQWQPRLLLLPDMIYFLYGPVFFLYIQRLLTIPSKGRFGPWFYFIPAFLHMLAYLPLLFIDTETFTSRVVDLSFKEYFIGAAALALVFNIYYWLKCNRMIKNYEYNTTNNYSFEENVQYLSTVINLKFICLLVWGLTYVIGFIGWWFQYDWLWLTDKFTDTIWILFSFTVFFLGYFAMKQPEIFRVAEKEVLEEPELNVVTNQTSNAEMEVLKAKLERIMKEEQPYLNPRLALSELADLAGTNVHTLSRLINEGFDKNFYDFVNSYRVEEFKKRIVLPAYKNQTFLALAFSVGFNSKTAFNRSFKKLTNSTPRKFLKEYESKRP